MKAHPESARAPHIVLVPPAPAPVLGALTLDPSQAVVHATLRGCGPVIVHGAPGSGKTTLLVETVAARVERDGVDPESVLVLAPTRRAAAILRDQLSARLSRTLREPIARTPHSYAFGVLRRHRVLAGQAAPRLISGPDQDAILRDLLLGHEEGSGRVPNWPPTLGEQVRSLRGFRDELRELLMVAVERGLAPRELARLGRTHARPGWVAAATVLGEYQEIGAIGLDGAYDPSGLVDAALGVLADEPELARAEIAHWQLIAVDDAQDFTSAGYRLLLTLTRGGRDALVMGDPDASTQTFRGAVPHAFAELPSRMRTHDKQLALVQVLDTVHRHGPFIRAAVHRVADRIGTAGGVLRRGAQGRGPLDPPLSDRAPGVVPSSRARAVQAHLLATGAAEATFIAATLRQAHLDQGIGWGEMAVIVRSVNAMAGLRRVFAAAGVPLAVDGSRLAICDEPGVQPLLQAMALSLRPDTLTPLAVAGLLTGPIGGADALALRRLRQVLRVREVASGGVRTSDDLLILALEDPGLIAGLDPSTTRCLTRVAEVLAAGRRAAARPGATAETLLWALWDAANLAESWRRRALGGGTSGARADADLDAVMALFEAAARFVDRAPRVGPAEFLASITQEQLPADTLAERAADAATVTLSTPAGVAGREFDLVVVAHVQEGVWPDLRLRSSLLGAAVLADLLDGRTQSPDEPVSALRRQVLDDELRSFLVAVSRAKRRLIVTAVRGEDDLPSPFIDLVDPIDDPEGLRTLTKVARPAQLGAIVAELRAACTDPELAEAARRRAAAHLAHLSREQVPGADPLAWHGLLGLSDDSPLQAANETVSLSPSRVEQFAACALRWLLETHGGSSSSGIDAELGTLVHEIAAEVPDGDRDRLSAALDVAIAQGRLGVTALGAGLVARTLRERAEELVLRYGEYAREAVRAGREVIGVEEVLKLDLGRAQIRGSVDRLERTAEGQVLIVDLKTGRSAPKREDVRRHPQLGLYQLGVEEGALPGPSGPEATAGGRLVCLGTGTASVTLREQPPLRADPEPGWARDLVAATVEGMSGAVFSANVNPMCRTCPVRRCCPVQVEGRQVGGDA